jgi:hypothetical protein
MGAGPTRDLLIPWDFQPSPRYGGPARQLKWRTGLFRLRVHPMDFDKRLERAISRGDKLRENRQRVRSDQDLSDEQLHSEHSRCRLELSEHIETCLRKLADYFPGFRFETVVSEEGWGARVSRGDINLVPGRPAGTQYSRLEIVVRPFSSAHIVELVSKATIRNKELFHRNNYQFVAQVDLQSLRGMVDLWVLEYAEAYAAGN